MDSRDNHVDKKKVQKDQVSISNEAQEMLEAHSQVKDPKHAERIQELKTAVSTGTYHIEANKLAEKLVPYFKSSVQSGEQS
ncbi:Anti-sigma-28 factor, FlgM [compost metagenome]